MTVTWLAEQISDGQVQVRIGRSGEQCIAEYPGLGTLSVGANGEGARYEFVPGLATEWQEKLINGLFGGMLWHAKGGFALHGSAVAVGDRGVILFGDSCAGKSSVAAELVRNYGARLLSDDAAVLMVEPNSVSVRHTESRSWLRPAVAEHFGVTPSPLGKIPFGPRFEREGVTPLVHLVHLSFEPNAPVGGVTRELTGIAALQQLLPHVIRLVLADHARERLELDQIEHILRLCRVSTLTRPQTMEELRPSCQFVLSLLK